MNWVHGPRPVSYTHLDVYKRQLVCRYWPKKTDLWLVPVHKTHALGIAHTTPIQSKYRVTPVPTMMYGVEGIFERGGSHLSWIDDIGFRVYGPGFSSAVA